MTADEVSFAGGKTGTSLTSPYAWYYFNSAGGSITGSTFWWLMSPNRMEGPKSLVYDVGGSGDPGYLGNDFVDGGGAVRPVLSLKSCTQYNTGNGSSSNPYTILETSSGC